jgi:hypothetical protein
VKLVYRAVFSRRGMGGTGARPGSVELVTEQEGYQRSAGILSMNDIIRKDNTLILRLERKGSLYTASCSADGKNFRTIGTADIILKDVSAGLIVCNGTDEDIPAWFRSQVPEPEPGDFKVACDYFRITSSGLR